MFSGELKGVGVQEIGVLKSVFSDTALAAFFVLFTAELVIA
jgi:hypothetical protein